MSSMDKNVVAAATEPHRQYLSFRLGGLEYGLDFNKVQELRPLRALERFAADGAIINGVVVSRGVIMPIVDMRIAFCSVPGATDSQTDVIILKLSSCVMGLVVDGVTDIVTLAGAQIEPIPADTDGGGVDYLLGFGRIGARRLILIDIDKLMSIRDDGNGSRQAA